MNIFDWIIVIGIIFMCGAVLGIWLHIVEGWNKDE